MRDRGLRAAEKTCAHCPSGLALFLKSNVPLIKKWLHCIQLWAADTPVSSAANQLEISRTTAIDLYNFIRGVCSTALLRDPVQLRGPGRIVQINESLFCHKVRYHRREMRREIWVFGMFDCSSSPATNFVQIVDRRDAANSLPIIERHT